MGMGMCYGLAELDNKAEFVHLGLELRLNLSFEDFPGWVGVDKSWEQSKSSVKLGPNWVHSTLCEWRGLLVKS